MLLQTKYVFAPEISIEFDEEKQRYLALVISRTGEHILEAPSRGGIQTEVDVFLRREYTSLVRELEHPEKGGQNHFTQKEREKSRTAEQALQYARTLSSQEEHFTGTTSLWDKMQTIGMHRYKAVIGGMVITAGSLRGLKRKIMVQRNRGIAIIIAAIRHHKKNQRLAMEYTRARLREKKEIASGLWSERVVGKKGDWRQRAAQAKEKLRAKSDISKGLLTSFSNKVQQQNTAKTIPSQHR